MVRKIKDDEIPARQKWLYQLLDMGLVKAVAYVWGILFIILILFLVALKFFFSHHK